eukprot:c15967_g1_i1.p1 GENE.c15967_g1_i1~~c15967_g1_i1.p1  ORF type:complete len:314 (+),score=72.70 c15967_g1_i1:69-944(+)
MVEVVCERKPFFGKPRVGQFKLTDFVLGTGASGKVVLAKKDGVHYAMKVVSLSGEDREKILARLENEVECLSLVATHPNIVSFNCAMVSKKNFFVATELASGGDLFDFVVSHAITVAVAKSLFSQVISAVGHMHSHGVAHRDLKPENILMHGDDPTNPQIRVCDFGFACKWTQGDIFRSDSLGTIRCLAPEIVKRKGHSVSYNPLLADIWCCGVILYFIVSGQFPFDADSVEDCMRNIIQRKFTSALPFHTPAEVINLIDGMLQLEPKKRLRIHEIATHPWLKTSRRLSHA